MRDPVPTKFKGKTFFQAKKTLRETTPTKLETGDYIGELDQEGKPINGILKVKKCGFLPEGIFVGEFGQDSLPSKGEF